MVFGFVCVRAAAPPTVTATGIGVLVAIASLAFVWGLVWVLVSNEQDARNATCPPLPLPQSRSTPSHERGSIKKRHVVFGGKNPPRGESFSLPAQAQFAIETDTR